MDQGTVSITLSSFMNACGLGRSKAERDSNRMHYPRWWDIIYEARLSVWKFQSFWFCAKVDMVIGCKGLVTAR